MQAHLILQQHILPLTLVVLFSLTRVCLFVRALTDKRLELSTPKSVDNSPWQPPPVSCVDHQVKKVKQAELGCVRAGLGLHVDKTARFYRAMLCIRGTSHGPVSVSVRLSQADVLLKRQSVGSHKQHHTIPQGL